ncbi:MAG: hypothetical protein WC375_02495 [Methanomassiliicoccales archaeon]
MPLMVYFGGCRIKHVTDENNDFEIFVSVIGIIILIAGISYLIQMSWGVGLMTAGLGLILLWIGGREILSFTGMNIMVPIGAVMMIAGMVLSSI